MDLTGPHVRSKNGLLTVIDYFTKYLICVPIRDKTALSVAKALVKHVYSLFGCPILQTSDMGVEFQNDVMRNIADLLGIHVEINVIPCVGGRDRRVVHVDRLQRYDGTAPEDVV